MLPCAEKDKIPAFLTKIITSRSLKGTKRINRRFKIIFTLGHDFCAQFPKYYPYGIKRHALAALDLQT